MKLYLEPRDGYFLAEVSGEASLEESIRSIDAVFASCREHGARGLLVDVRGVAGSSSVTDRYLLGTHLAKSAMRMIRTALLCREDQWMADRPLENTAVNRGAPLKTTVRLEEALVWLGADPMAPVAAATAPAMSWIRKSDYQRMPWKNGMGETAEIDRVPAGGESYLWRLSQAWVRRESPFSRYPGCDRWLTVWQGEGLLLNDRALPPLSPIRFKGEEEIHCKPLGGEVVDVGLIFDRARVDASMAVVAGRVALDAPGVHYLFDVTTGDTLRITAPGEASVLRGLLVSVRERPAHLHQDAIRDA